MIINDTNLEALRKTLNASFQSGLTLAQSDWDKVAMAVPSTAGENIYPWLKDIPGMREWIGPRQKHGLAENAYRVPNKDFEDTISIPRNAILDDTVGTYGVNAKMLGSAAAVFPNQLIFQAMRDGFTTGLAFDGLPLFSASHPIILADGSVSAYANTDGGAGTNWFLMIDHPVLKPLILQKRQDPLFTSLDRPNDPNLFFNKEFIYGVDARYGVGYTFPQLIWGSKQALSATTFELALTSLRAMKGDFGRPLGNMNAVLIVPASLEGAARDVVVSATGASGATNKWKDAAKLVISPWL